MQLTQESLNLFLSLADDAPNWSDNPLIDIDKAQRGNLADLKKKGLIKTTTDGGCVFAMFTKAGMLLAAQHGREVQALV